MIDFCRNHHARLYPLVRGIIYLASHVPVDIITLNSHLGTMPSLGTIKSALKGFSKQKALPTCHFSVPAGHGKAPWRIKHITRYMRLNDLEAALQLDQEALDREMPGDKGPGHTQHTRSLSTSRQTDTHNFIKRVIILGIEQRYTS